MEKIKMFCILAIAFATMMTSSCASHKTVSESNIVDSVNIKDSTVVNIKTIYKDSIRWRDSVSVIVNEKGEILGKNSWHWRDHSNVNEKIKTKEVIKYKYKYINRKYYYKVYIKEHESFVSKVFRYVGIVCVSILILILIFMLYKKVIRF